MLWSQLASFSPDFGKQIFNLYRTSIFPIDVRQHAAPWIENCVPQFQLKNDNQPEGFENFKKALLTEIDRLVLEFENSWNYLLEYNRLYAARHVLQAIQAPVLYKTLKDLLEKEDCMKHAEEQNSKVEQMNRQNTVTPQWARFTQDMATITVHESDLQAYYTHEFHGKYKDFHGKIKKKYLFQRLLTRLPQDPNNNPDAQNKRLSLEKSIAKLTAEIEHDNCTLPTLEPGLIQRIQTLVSQVEEFVTKMFDELVQPLKWSSWALEDNPPPINVIESWYSGITELAHRVSETLANFLREFKSDQVMEANWKSLAVEAIHALDKICEKLKANSLVVDTQPPQVFKKGPKFPNCTTSCRFLCGSKLFPNESKPQVKVILLNEEEAKHLFQNGTSALEALLKPRKGGQVASGKLKGDEGSKVTRRSNGVVYNFGDLAVEDVERKSKNGKKTKEDEVMNEKYCFVFYTKMKIGSDTVTDWCVSHPVVIYVQTNQRLQGWSTIFWDSLRQRSRQPFDVPPAVPWERLALALNKYFQERTGTTRNLTETNLIYLREKILGGTVDHDGMTVTKRDLYETENSNGMTFWKWFSQIILLVEDPTLNLKEPWDKGYIVGFIDRTETEKRLIATKQDGAFIIRFSDSQPGALTISYAIELEGTFIADAWEPAGKEDLKYLDLPSRIRAGIDLASGHTKFCTLVYYFSMSNSGVEAQCSEELGIAFPVHKKQATTRNSSRRPYVQTEIVIRSLKPCTLPIRQETMSASTNDTRLLGEINGIHAETANQHAPVQPVEESGLENMDIEDWFGVNLTQEETYEMLQEDFPTFSFSDLID